MNNRKITIQYTTILVLILAALVYSFLVLLDFNFVKSDVLSYWQDSLSWTSPFHAFHVPGFPLLIALLRGLIFNVFPNPITYMVTISLSSLIASIFILFKFFNLQLEISNFWKFLFVITFSLWPFIGLTYVVYPVADITAIFFYIAGLYFFIKKREYIGSALWAGALITHKALWLFVLLGFMAWFVTNRSSRGNKIFLSLTIISTPLLLLWFFGAQFHHDYFWIISQNLNVEVQSKGTFPIMDGLLGTLLSGGLKAIVKGGFLLSIFILTIICLIFSIKYKPLFWQYGLSIIFPLLILSSFLNQHEIWAVARFSRLLVLPIFWLIPVLMKNKEINPRIRIIILALVIVGLFTSQLAYAYYMARIYFG